MLKGVSNMPKLIYPKKYPFCVDGIDEKLNVRRGIKQSRMDLNKTVSILCRWYRGEIQCSKTHQTGHQSTPRLPRQHHTATRGLGRREPKNPPRHLASERVEAASSLY